MAKCLESGKKISDNRKLGFSEVRQLALQLRLPTRHRHLAPPHLLDLHSQLSRWGQNQSLGLANLVKEFARKHRPLSVFEAAHANSDARLFGVSSHADPRRATRRP